MAHVQTAQEIYEAFGRGDVPAILERLDEQVVWDAWPANSRVPEAVPYLRTRRGREEVGQFFADVMGALQFERFEPAAFLASEDQVAVVIDVAMATEGGRIEDSEIHLWTFGEDGKVTELRHYLDSLQHADAQG